MDINRRASVRTCQNNEKQLVESGMIKTLLKEFVSHGDKGAVVPVSRFDDLKRDMEALQSGDYHRWSDWMAVTMTIGDELGFKPRSLISVITPSPKVVLEFNVNGKPFYCVVPPQYADEHTKDQEVLQYINAYLMQFGLSAAVAENLPQKLLAVHCGLGRYGRNNICFNETFGSYLRVLSYVSDMPCDETDWFPVRRMETCETCYICINACPTKAIQSSHQVVNADICLTFFNEFEGEFPDWICDNFHNSIIGCTKCQDCCPKNAHNKNNIKKGVVFTEKETAELLSHKSDEPFSDLLGAKIEATGIASEFKNILPRNLAALLCNR